MGMRQAVSSCIVCPSLTGASATDASDVIVQDWLSANVCLWGGCLCCMCARVCRCCLCVLAGGLYNCVAMLVVVYVKKCALSRHVLIFSVFHGHVLAVAEWSHFAEGFHA